MANDPVIARLNEIDHYLSIVWKRDIGMLQLAALTNVVLLGLILWRVW